jgi:hypothetical protein
MSCTSRGHALTSHVALDPLSDPTAPAHAAAAHWVPRAAVIHRPLQQFQVANRCCVTARRLAPRAALLLRPLQQLQVAAASCGAARALVPGPALPARPLQQLQIVPPCWRAHWGLAGGRRAAVNGAARARRMPARPRLCRRAAAASPRRGTMSQTRHLTAALRRCAAASGARDLCGPASRAFAAAAAPDRNNEDPGGGADSLAQQGQRELGLASVSLADLRGAGRGGGVRPARARPGGALSAMRPAPRPDAAAAPRAARSAARCSLLAPPRAPHRAPPRPTPTPLQRCHAPRCPARRTWSWTWGSPARSG